jgi:ectoine hydroxylase-related dioxygenase (phytanoyl-CoA dioxygenase family)
VGDRRPHASYGYVEIVDHDFAGEVPVLMQPGDLLVFHSHLMHRSTDNDSPTPRYAMVYHLAEGGTIDQSEERWGFTPPNTDWLPVRRAGRPAGERQ